VHKTRLAKLNDIDNITELIVLSARKLGGEYYDKSTIGHALKGAFGVDTQLIKDNTYYVIQQNEQIIACGGWSYRKTLFGSDTNNIRNPEKLDVKIDAAKIRAFFIHPNFARQGLGKIILDKCESKAKQYGFTQIQLMSTLSGIKFYKKSGYVGQDFIFHSMYNNNTIKFLPMQKRLD